MDEKGEMEDEKLEAMKPVKLVSVANSTEADMILNLLLNNEIPCFKKQKGSGSYMSLFYGFSIYGTEIYVDEQDYSRALEIVKEINEVHSDTIVNGNDTEYNVSKDVNESSDFTDDFKEEIEDESSDFTDDFKVELEDDSYKSYAFYRNPRIIVRIYLVVMVGLIIAAYIINASR